MPMDDTELDRGEPVPEPRSRDDRDDRDYSTPDRVAERVERNELPPSEGAPPDEHPAARRSAAAGKAAPEPEPGDDRER